LLNDQLEKRYGFRLKVTTKEAGKNAIVLNYERMDKPLPGAYTLQADVNGIYIAGDNATGVFYGTQTLLQLLPSKTTLNSLPVAYVSITDYPRFAYRGMHLDVARHFYPVADVKKYIDQLAGYKFNTFHWHLTDDQGWRIEIKKYPLLTKVGGYRNGTIIGRYPGKGNDSIQYGGFYTQQQIKDIVKYAADRYITVIPEIEMPGHSSAAIAAYPQLSCFPADSTKTGSTPWAGTRSGKQVQQTWGVFEDVYCPSDYTFNFLQDVLDEVLPLFPSKYIHIGGDECPKEAWKQSAFCQQLIKDKGLKDEHGLQSYFIQRIEKYINSKGRSIIGWDEILEGGLAPNATVMSWRGEEGGIQAAQQNHDVIMTPGAYCYLDHSQSQNEDSVTIGGYLPLEKVYGYEPVPASLTAAQAKHVLGAQGNVWTEYIGNQSKLEYMIFPRMMALSEVLWTPKEKRNYADFERRLPVLLDRLNAAHINYSRAYYDLKATVIPAGDNDGVLWKLESKNKTDKIIYTTGFEDNAAHTYTQPFKPAFSGATCTAWMQNDKGEIISNTIKQKFYFNKVTGKSISLVNPPAVNYPGDGAFTLVNGVQNEKGLARSNEFLGFLGKDLDATIDLGKLTSISKVTIHVLDQNGSWIYLPASVEVTYQPDVDKRDDMTFPKEIKVIDRVKDKGIRTIVVEGKHDCRFLQVVVKNLGIIPAGNPGAGTPAWLFVDEIEAE